MKIYKGTLGAILQGGVSNGTGFKYGYGYGDGYGAGLGLGDGFGLGDGYGHGSVSGTSHNFDKRTYDAKAKQLIANKDVEVLV